MLVTNWHVLSPEPDVITVGGVPVGRLGDETPEAFARGRLGDLWDDEPLMVLNDEGHHAYRPAPVGGKTTLSSEEKADREEATVWVSGLDRINAACGIRLCVDLSATPFYLQGSGYPEGSPFPWIVSDFSVVDAIESGITKIPRLPAIDSTGRPDPVYFKLWEHVVKRLKPGDRLPGGKPKPEAAWREAEAALLTLAGEWKERFDQVQASAPGQDRTPPVMIAVCDNTDVAEHFHRMISGEELVEAAGEAGAAEEAEEDEDDGEGDSPRGRRKKKPKAVKRYGTGLPGFPELWNRDGAEVTLRIDSKLLAAAESEDPKATRKHAAEELRKIVSTVGAPGEPGERIRCVVSVNMLSEGWDANNVTHILGLRAFHSQLLCEQVVGRGLRRMDYTPDPETGLLSAEYVDVFGVPFSLIPFKGRQAGRRRKTVPGTRSWPCRSERRSRSGFRSSRVTSCRSRRAASPATSTAWSGPRWIHGPRRPPPSCARRSDTRSATRAHTADSGSRRWIAGGTTSRCTRRRSRSPSPSRSCGRSRTPPIPARSGCDAKAAGPCFPKCCASSPTISASAWT